jgi:hypothetical protein
VGFRVRWARRRGWKEKFVRLGEKIKRVFQNLERIKDIENKDSNTDGTKSEPRKEERGRKRVSKTFPKLDFFRN